MIGRAAIGEVVGKPISGEWGSGEGTTPVLRTANFRNNGELDYSKLAMRNVPLGKVHKKSLKRGDTIIEKSGGSPNQPVGRVVYFDRDGTYLCNNFTSILRPDTSTVDSKYLFYQLYCKHKYGAVLKYQNKTTGIINLKLDRYLETEEIPLPLLPEQKRIAAILDTADQLRKKDQQLIEHYTRLGQSLFLEMFGDSVTNPMGWKTRPLDEISEINSGVTKGRRLHSSAIIDIPYMRVANVLAGRLDLSEVKTIPGTTNDLEKYGLKRGDVLLTEGGDPDKLGRGTVWNEEISDCIHQNHIFRVRVTDGYTNPVYLSWLCGSEYGKRYFLKSGKQTTGIASINKTQLKRFPVLRPPAKLQNAFCAHLERVKQQTQVAETSLKRTNNLFNSLLQRAFKGELTT